MNELHKAIDSLKKLGIIKFDSDLVSYVPYKKAIISSYKKSGEPTDAFVDSFNAAFASHGIKIPYSTQTVKQFEKIKGNFEEQGYNNLPVSMSNAGQTTLMKVAVGNSYAALEFLSRLVSHTERRPLEEVKKEAETIARERLRIVEDMLFGLISS